MADEPEWMKAMLEDTEALAYRMYDELSHTGPSTPGEYALECYEKQLRTIVAFHAPPEIRFSITCSVQLTDGQDWDMLITNTGTSILCSIRPGAE